MFGRISSVLLIALLFAGVIISAAVPAMADEMYMLNKDFHIVDSDITIHIVEVNVTDKYMGNIYPPNNVEDTHWAHLVYYYENTGDTAEIGHIQYELIDTNGNVYQFNPNGTEYSGETVQPHSVSIQKWNEIPIPKDVTLAKVRVFEGTNPNYLLADETFDLPPATTVATTTATPAAAASATAAASTGGLGCCAPLLSFLAVGGIAAVGIYVKGRGIKK